MKKNIKQRVVIHMIDMLDKNRRLLNQIMKFQDIKNTI